MDDSAEGTRDNDNKRSSEPPPVQAPKGAREAAVAKEPGRVRRLFKILGPGLISGASDDDPATIGTCASVGAQLGFIILWPMLWILPLMMAAQYISAKIGLVTGQGLAGVVRQQYSRWLLVPIVVALAIASTINAGADLGAIADAINLLIPSWPAAALVAPIAIAIVGFQILGRYRLIERVFTWLAVALLAYIGAGLLAHPPPGQVAWYTLIPHIRLDRPFLAALVAILGTSFSPYLYFWQSSQEVEEKVALGRRHGWQRRGTSSTELKYVAWDVNLGMAASNLVSYFVILATAATLFRAGQTHIGSAREAAEALRPICGDAAGVLLAMGLIGSGLLAVPVLTATSAYALSEAFCWKLGLSRTLREAPQFYAVIIVSTGAGVLLNFAGINPIKALVITSTIYGFLAPPLLLMLVLISRNRAIMGGRAIGRVVSLLGWTATVVTLLAAVAMIVVYV